jgi:rhodanese-related sulfurtransferase
MKRPHPLAATAFTAVLVLGGASACSNDDSPNTPAAAQAPESDASGPAAGVEAATVALDEGRTVIDVRTVEEYDAGHVEGAERIGLADPDFAERIAALDPAESYVVYCRSGNRSAQAAEVMRAAGLTVLDGGALDDMAAAGWATA